MMNDHNVPIAASGGFVLILGWLMRITMYKFHRVYMNSSALDL